MQIGQAALIDDPERILEHFFSFSRKARDDVGPEHHVRAARFEFMAKRDGIFPCMAPLHPLQDHVVAGLQRQMDMRHQPRFPRQHLHAGMLGEHAVQLPFWQVEIAARGAKAPAAARASIAITVGTRELRPAAPPVRS